MTSQAAPASAPAATTASRVGDLNPEEFENIEVVKGPSAATLYGTDAATGSSSSRPRRGARARRAGRRTARAATSWDQNNYPLNYTIAGRSPGSTALRTCSLPQVSAGTCLQDSVRTYSPLPRSGRDAARARQPAAARTARSPAAPRRCASSRPGSARRRPESCSCSVRAATLRLDRHPAPRLDRPAQRVSARTRCV
jgi:hypothetical protein